MKRAIIVDLDGTLVANENRPPSLYTKPTGGTDWEAWLTHCPSDPMAEWCANLVMAMSKTHTIIFMTGRRISNAETVTRDWLAAHLPDLEEYELFMRAEKDFRSAELVKLDLYYRYVANNYQVDFAVDDLKENCDVFRTLGITALLCADR